MNSVAVVTIVHGRHDHLRNQQRSLAHGSRQPDLHVVVVMQDPAIECVLEQSRREFGLDIEPVWLEADPAALPLAAARNRGMELALDRGHEVLIGLDVDCLAGPGLVSGYAHVVAGRPTDVWSGPVTYLDPAPPAGYCLEDLPALDMPHPARPSPEPGQVIEQGDPLLFWSLSFALSADAWRRSGGFDEAYVGYGGEDTDFAYRAWNAGVGFGWVGDARAYHQHHPVSDPPVEHLDDILRNGRLFRDRWGEWPMRGWLEEFVRRGLVRHLGEDYVRA